MAVIDEKGRLFGKINLIDLSVVIFVLLIMPMFYFGYKLYVKGSIANPVEGEIEEFIDIEIPCNIVKVNSDILKLIKIGDKELDKNGNIIGEILWLGDYRPYQYSLDLNPSQTYKKDSPLFTNIPALIRIKTSVKDDKLYYKGKLIAIESFFNFVTDKYSVFVTPSKYPTGAEKEEMKLDLFITFKNLTEDIAKQISPGDRELDSKGNVIAQVLDVGKIEDNIQQINLGNGYFVFGKDTSRKQINTKMRLKVVLKDNEQLYFKERTVDSNSFVDFNTSRYKIKGRLSPFLSKEVPVSVMVKFTSTIPELVKLIKKDDTVKDTSGRVIGRIKSILSDTPSEVQMLALQENKFISVPNPTSRDMIVSIDLLCEEKDGSLFFKDYPVKVANMLTFTTSVYSVTGTVIGFENK